MPVSSHYADMFTQDKIRRDHASKGEWIVINIHDSRDPYAYCYSMDLFVSCIDATVNNHNSSGDIQGHCRSGACAISKRSQS